MGLNTCLETAAGSDQKKGAELQIGPESRIRYAHLLPVFGNGPAGDAQTFLFQGFCDFIIAHRACAVFIADQFLNALADDVGGCVRVFGCSV